MDPYVHHLLERNARDMRDRAAPHICHLREVVAERAAALRIRRLRSLRALLGMLRRHAYAARVAAGAGGRP
jgi:hypothetical protein